MKQIKGTNYSLTKDGNVISGFTGKKICNRKRDDGYIVVNLYIDKKPKYFYLHRLLAEYYIDNPKNKKYVNHKNGNKSDNRIENLEWCSASENSKHAMKMGLSEAPVFKGSEHGMSKITNEQVNDIRILYKTGMYNQVQLGRLYGLGQSHISRIIRGESWSHT